MCNCGFGFDCLSSDRPFDPVWEFGEDCLNVEVCAENAESLADVADFDLNAEKLKVVEQEIAKYLAEWRGSLVEACMFCGNENVKADWIEVFVDGHDMFRLCLECWGGLCTQAK